MDLGIRRGRGHLYPPGHWQPPTWDTVRQIPAAMRVFGRRLPLALRVLTTMQKHHPPRPHWYLYYLATERGHQGTGIGTALMRQVLQQCDQQRLPAYLEATSERNRALYLRHGFEDRHRLDLPGGPPVYPMWREPQ
jgi:GNAT superfamily N-acetyltransferase